MSDNNLSISSSRDAQSTLVTLGGDIDLRNSPALRTTLLELVDAAPRRVVMDLSGVTYVDSSGVGTLVEFKRKLERVGGQLVLAGMQPRVRGVFEITRLDRFFTITDNVAEARQS